jgi:hypothetical protein
LSGQIEQLIGLAQALEHRGHTVSVVSAFPSQVLLGSDRFDLARQPRRPLIETQLGMARIFADLVRLASQVDLLQVNLPTPSFSILADVLALVVRVPVLVDFEAHLANPSDLLRFDRLGTAPAFFRVC